MSNQPADSMSRFPSWHRPSDIFSLTTGIYIFRSSALCPDCGFTVQRTAWSLSSYCPLHRLFKTHVAPDLTPYCPGIPDIHFSIVPGGLFVTVRVSEISEPPTTCIITTLPVYGLWGIFEQLLSLSERWTMWELGPVSGQCGDRTSAGVLSTLPAVPNCWSLCSVLVYRPVLSTLCQLGIIRVHWLSLVRNVVGYWAISYCNTLILSNELGEVNLGDLKQKIRLKLSWARIYSK